jgi:hypothetical protein
MRETPFQLEELCVPGTKNMVKPVEGIYRNGKVELVEPLAEAEGSRAIVTFVHLASLLIFANEGSSCRSAPPVGFVY